MRTRVAASVAVVLSIALTVGLAAAFAVGGQSSEFGSIAGTVTDPAGAALPGVTVTLTGPERRAGTTNERGEFRFGGLLPGLYEARAELAGFRAAVTRVTVVAGRTERMTVRMGLSGVEETVTVAAETPASPPSPAAATPPVVVGVAGGVIGGVAGGIGGGAYRPGGAEFPRRYSTPFDTEAYDHLDENPFRRVSVDALSTFSIDVDTASYANLRRFLTDGTLPPAGAVRIEELLNYFRYDYPQPPRDVPFSVTTELTPSPWNPKHRLALIGLQGRALDEREPAPRNWSS